MTPEETRLNLDATTLRPQDTAPESRAALESDSDLAAWQSSRREFDEKVASAMADVPVPEDLRAKLLQLQAMTGETAVTVSAPVSSPSKPRFRRLDGALTFLAGLCVIAVAAVVLWGPKKGSPDMPDWQMQTLAAVKKIDKGEMRLDHFSGNFEELKSLLVKGNQPVPVSLPKGVGELASLGCKTFQVEGRPVTVVCFRIGTDSEAHVVVMNNEGLKDLPPQHKPEFVQRDDWNIARWSDGPQSYFIATRAPKGMLEKLFAMVVLDWRL